jgi:hypothetical protein
VDLERRSDGRLEKLRNVVFPRCYKGDQIKEYDMTSVGLVAHTKEIEIRYTYKILVGKSEVKRLWGSRYRWGDYYILEWMVRQ